MISAKEIDTIIKDCLSGFDEKQKDVKKFIFTTGCMNTLGFDPERIQKYQERIREILMELPDEFRESGGGGWSFLQGCVDRDGHHWGEHRNVDALMMLGLATGDVIYLLPQSCWKVLPGGLPYFVILNERQPVTPMTIKEYEDKLKSQRRG